MLPGPRAFGASTPGGALEVAGAPHPAALAIIAAQNIVFIQEPFTCAYDFFLRTKTCELVLTLGLTLMLVLLLLLRTGAAQFTRF